MLSKFIRTLDQAISCQLTENLSAEKKSGRTDGVLVQFATRDFVYLGFQLTNSFERSHLLIK